MRLLRLHIYTYERFDRAFLRPRKSKTASSSTSIGDGAVRLWAHQGLLFVFINSMALEGDGCRFCQRASEEMELLTKRLQCLRGELALSSCQDDFTAITEPDSERMASSKIIYSLC